MINLYIIYIFILFTLILNFTTYLKYRKKYSKREKFLYSYLLFSVLLWLITYALSDIIKDEFWAVLSTRLTILFPLNVLNAVAQIAKNYPRIIGEKATKKTFKFINIFVISFTVISLLLLNTNLNLTSYEIIPDGPIDFTPGLLYVIIPILSLFIITSKIIYWKKNFPYYTKTQKIQVLSLLSVLIFIYLSLSFGLVALPLLGLSVYSPFMFLSLSLLLFIINKSLWSKVVVFDIQEEIIKLSGLIISTVILILTTSFTNLIEINLNFVSQFLATFLLISLIFSIYSGLNNLYKKNRKLLQQRIATFIEESTLKISVIDIATSLKENLKEILFTNDISLKIFDGDINEIEKEIKGWWSLRSSTPIINREILIESYFDKENNKEITSKIFLYFQKNNIDLLIPISNRRDLIGLVYINNSNKVLNESDYKALELLSNTVSVSISRALIYEQVQSLNASLKDRVAEQTKQLQQQLKELEAARRKEMDMIDIMGHELRTPMSIIKLNTDLLHNFTENITKRKEDFKKYVTRIKKAVETEIKLINTLLTTAKLQGEKIELNPEKVDIIEQIEMALHAHEGEAKKKDLKIITKYEESSKYIFADHARTVEIVNNLIDNAIKYTERGSVTVITEKEGEYIRTSIIDTGPGIKKEDLPQLGEKFFRTENYINDENGQKRHNLDIVRPGGTGLGLYVTFGLVEKMGGEIHIETEIGKGSNFTFTLPKYKGQGGERVEETKDMFARLGLKKDNEINNNSIQQ